MVRVGKGGWRVRRHKGCFGSVIQLRVVRCCKSLRPYPEKKILSGRIASREKKRPERGAAASLPRQEIAVPLPKRNETHAVKAGCVS